MENDIPDVKDHEEFGKGGIIRNLTKRNIIVSFILKNSHGYTVSDVLSIRIILYLYFLILLVL